MHHKIMRKWVQNLSCHCYLMKILTFCFAKTLKDLLIKNFHFLLMISHFMSQYRIPPHFITITSAKKKNFQIPTWNKNKNIVGVEWHHFYHLIYDKSPKKSFGILHTFFHIFSKEFCFCFPKKQLKLLQLPNIFTSSSSKLGDPWNDLWSNFSSSFINSCTKLSSASFCNSLELIPRNLSCSFSLLCLNLSRHL